MAANDRYVRQRPDGGWDVLKEGHRRATASSPTRGGAVARAKALTRQDGNGQVRVLNRSGKIVATKPVK